jgi:hypothetical protein
LIHPEDMVVAQIANIAVQRRDDPNAFFWTHLFDNAAQFRVALRAHNEEQVLETRDRQIMSAQVEHNGRMDWAGPLVFVETDRAHGWRQMEGGFLGIEKREDHAALEPGSPQWLDARQQYRHGSCIIVGSGKRAAGIVMRGQQDGRKCGVTPWKQRHDIYERATSKLIGQFEITGGIRLKAEGFQAFSKVRPGRCMSL